MDGAMYLQRYNDETDCTTKNIHMEGRELVDAFKIDPVERKPHFNDLTNDEKYLPSDLSNAAGSHIEADIFSEIPDEVKTEVQPIKQEFNASTESIISTNEIQRDSIKAMKEHCTTYCQKCNKNKPVIPWKTRCSTCKTALTYSCDKCKKSYKRYVGLHDHIKRMDIGLPSEPVYRSPSNNCRNCGRTFWLKWKKIVHERRCDIETKFNCLYCGKNYMKKAELRRHHLLYCDNMKLLKCAHCDKKVYLKTDLIKHLRSEHSLSK